MPCRMHSAVHGRQKITARTGKPLPSCAIVFLRCTYGREAVSITKKSTQGSNAVSAHKKTAGIPAVCSCTFSVNTPKDYAMGMPFKQNNRVHIPVFFCFYAAISLMILRKASVFSVVFFFFANKMFWNLVSSVARP